MTPEEQELLAAEQIGQEAKKFQESVIGRYLEGVAAQDEADAKEELMRLNVWQFSDLHMLQNAISHIQDRVTKYRTIQQYLKEAISEGEQASFVLNNPEGED